MTSAVESLRDFNADLTICEDMLKHKLLSTIFVKQVDVWSGTFRCYLYKLSITRPLETTVMETDIFDLIASFFSPNGPSISSSVVMRHRLLSELGRAL